MAHRAPGIFSRGALHVIATNQYIRRQFQSVSKPAYHFQSQRTHAIEHFGNARTRTEIRLQVFARKAPGLRDVLQEFDGVRVVNQN
jgi:hypothetical protein